MYSAVHHSNMINGICKFVNCIMNYLAHAYLSSGDPSIPAGNMISDYVKGKKKFDYPDGCRKAFAFIGSSISLPITIR